MGRISLWVMSRAFLYVLVINAYERDGTALVEYFYYGSKFFAAPLPKLKGESLTYF